MTSLFVQGKDKNVHNSTEHCAGGCSQCNTAKTRSKKFKVCKGKIKVIMQR